VHVLGFRDRAFVPELPLLITTSTDRFADTRVQSQIPAVNKWFMPTPCGTQTLNYGYLRKFEHIFLPYELVGHSVNFNDISTTALGGDRGRTTLRDDSQLCAKSSTISERNSFSESTSFQRFTAPLQLLLAASQSDNPPQLYIAQAQLDDLPKALRDDVPTPHLVLDAGKGDIYDANIWMGIPPTYTPLHKDPNPNLFAQLCGNKCVRLFKPKDGLSIFLAARTKAGGYASAAFRGEEMMQGAERRALEDAVWNCPSSATGYEVLVRPGDALFIPKGWWHSIKSTGKDITASVSCFWNQIENGH
jgi:hypothetical protein